MRERAEHIGAEFELTTTPGVGTTVAVIFGGSRAIAKLSPGKLEATHES